MSAQLGAQVGQAAVRPASPLDNYLSRVQEVVGRLESMREVLKSSNDRLQGEKPPHPEKSPQLGAGTVQHDGFIGRLDHWTNRLGEATSALGEEVDRAQGFI